MSTTTATANPVTQDDLDQITAEASARAERCIWFIPDNPELRVSAFRQNLIDHHRCAHLPLAEFKECITGPWVVVT